MSSEDVVTDLGVNPSEIPTFLSLTGPSGKRMASIDLTNRQAIKLIDLYCDLENIYCNLSRIKNNTIRSKLNINRKVFLSRYSKLLKKKTKIVPSCTLDEYKWELANSKNEKILASYVFFPLQSLLVPPE